MNELPRIYAPPAAGATTLPSAPGPTPPAKQAEGDAPYLSKLMTMFPAEAVTVYTLGIQSLTNSLLPIFGTLIAMLVVRWAAFKPADGGPTNRLALVVSGVSFLLWVAAGGDAALLEIITKMAPSLTLDTMKSGSTFLIVLWTWVMPNFVKLSS